MRALRGVLPVDCPVFVAPVILSVMSPIPLAGVRAVFGRASSDIDAGACRAREAAARFRARAAPTISAPRFALRTFFRVPRTGRRTRRCPVARLFVLPPRIIVASLVTLSAQRRCAARPRI
jgi:hypothetical protein